jgi:hypothetical protein
LPASVCFFHCCGNIMDSVDAMCVYSVLNFTNLFCTCCSWITALHVILLQHPFCLEPMMGLKHSDMAKGLVTIHWM